MIKRWNYKAGILLLLCIITTCILTKNVQAQEPQTIIVPVALDVTKATGIDINLRLNPELVETAEISKKEDCLADAMVMEKQTGDKLKVGIASSKEINNKGTLFSLKLTLKKAVTEEDELVKVLQVRVNEKTVYKADNCILVNGVTDGKTYHNAVSIGFNEGTAMLNGAVYKKNDMVAEEGDHVLEITDLNGNKRTISFTIKYVKKIVINEVTPSSIDLLGGKAIVLGENFTEDMILKLAGKELAFTYISGNSIEFQVPQGNFGMVDLELINSIGQVTTVSNAITYCDTTSSIQIEEAAKIDGQFKLPIIVNSKGSVEDIALTVKTDGSFFEQIQFEAVNDEETLDSNISYTEEGVITLGIHNTKQIKTDGVIGYLVLIPKEVIITATVPIDLTAAKLNGVNSSNLIGCTVTLEPNLSIEGTVRYYSNNIPLTGVSIGTNLGTTAYTNEAGQFMLNSIKQNLVVLTPSFEGNVNGAISSQDAAMVLSAIVETASLNQNQTLAADVNGDGQVNAMDASYILQKAVGIIEGAYPGSNAEWIFTPGSRNLTLTGNAFNVDFTGILLGDVTGNWQLAEDNLE